MIDWTTLITSIISILATSGFVYTAADRRRYKKENEQLKKNEVKSSTLDNESKHLDNEAKSLDNDMKQMDVGAMYLEKVQSLANVIESSAKKMAETNERRDEDWATLKEDMEYVKGEVGSISEYLNGDYQQFKNKKRRYGKTKVTKREVPRKKGWSGADVSDVQVRDPRDGQVARPSRRADTHELRVQKVQDPVVAGVPRGEVETEKLDDYGEEITTRQD